MVLHDMTLHDTVLLCGTKGVSSPKETRGHATTM